MTADPPPDLLPLFPEHSSVAPDGELAIGGVGVRDLAERFGTPAYIVDEAGLRNQARRMRDGLAARHPDSEVVFASKSFPCLAAYKLFAAEGLSIDVAEPANWSWPWPPAFGPSAYTCTATPRPPPS